MKRDLRALLRRNRFPIRLEKSGHCILFDRHPAGGDNDEDDSGDLMNGNGSSGTVHDGILLMYSLPGGCLGRFTDGGPWVYVKMKNPD